MFLVELFHYSVKFKKGKENFSSQNSKDEKENIQFLSLKRGLRIREKLLPRYINIVTKYIAKNRKDIISRAVIEADVIWAQTCGSWKPGASHTAAGFSFLPSSWASSKPKFISVRGRLKGLSSTADFGSILNPADMFSFPVVYIHAGDDTSTDYLFKDNSFICFHPTSSSPFRPPHLPPHFWTSRNSDIFPNCHHCSRLMIYKRSHSKAIPYRAYWKNFQYYSFPISSHSLDSKKLAWFCEA